MKYNKEALIDLFDFYEESEEPFLSQTSYIVEREGLRLDCNLDNYEEIVTLSLFFEGRFSFSCVIACVSTITVEGKKLSIYKADHDRAYLCITLGEQFSFHYEDLEGNSVLPSKKIDGYYDFELLELFDDARVVSNEKEVQSFYANLEPFAFGVSIIDMNNNVFFSLENQQNHWGVFSLSFFNITRIIKDKNSVRFLKKNEEQVCSLLFGASLFVDVTI